MAMSKNVEWYEDALRDDEVAFAVGDVLVNGLKMRADLDYPDRVKTAWGSKTKVGLARIVFDQMLMAIDGAAAP